MESINPNSDFQWLTSQFSSENCKWLNENIEGVDQHIKNLLKLIEEDENSSANKKPELMACVEEFSNMHHLLAEKYSNLIGDFSKNFPIPNQVQPPQIPDFASHPGFEEELRVSSEKLRLSEETVSRLESELKKDKAVILLMDNLQAEIESAKSNIAVRDEGLEMEKRNVVELQKRVVELESQIFDSGCEISTLEEELKITKEKLVRSEEERNELKDKFLIKISQSQNHQQELQSQLEAAKEEITSLESSINIEKSQVLCLQEKLFTYVAEINSLHKANEISTLEKVKLQSDIDSLLEQKVFLETKIEDLDLKSKFLENELEHMKSEKLETTKNLEQELKKKCGLVDTLNLRYDLMTKDKDLACAEVDMLKEIVGVQANETKEMESNFCAVKLELESAKKLSDELRLRVDELEKERYRTAEEKRAAIRELCFSLEHYRTRYQEIRKVHVEEKRSCLLAW